MAESSGASTATEIDKNMEEVEKTMQPSTITVDPSGTSSGLPVVLELEVDVPYSDSGLSMATVILRQLSDIETASKKLAALCSVTNPTDHFDYQAIKLKQPHLFRHSLESSLQNYLTHNFNLVATTNMTRFPP